MLVPGDPGAAVDEHLDRGRPGRQVGRADHHGEARRGAGQCPDRPAAGPGHGQAEQRVLDLEAVATPISRPARARAAGPGPALLIGRLLSPAGVRTRSAMIPSSPDAAARPSM